MSDKFGFEDDIQQVVTDNVSDISRVSELLLDNRFGRRKSRIEKRVVSVISTLDSISVIYGIEWLQKWIPYYLEYSTSVDGEARKDIRAIAEAGLQRNEERFDRMIDMMGKR